jgi:hypothetical protein
VIGLVLLVNGTQQHLSTVIVIATLLVGAGSGIASGAAYRHRCYPLFLCGRLCHRHRGFGSYYGDAAISEELAKRSSV